MASVYRRKQLVHVTTDPDGKRRGRLVSLSDARKLKGAGERIDERLGRRWYVRYRDASGAWCAERCTARTKAEALRLADVSSERRSAGGRGSSRSPAIQA